MKKIIIHMIKIHHLYIAPFLPYSCRFHPTCSEYTTKAIEKYGILKGIPLGIWRVLRCNPFNKGGYDPIP